MSDKTTITLERTQAALVFTPNGIDLYIPGLFNATEVQPHIVIASAVAVLATQDSEWRNSTLQAWDSLCEKSRHEAKEE